jgi:outer membrane protein TolC
MKRFLVLLLIAQPLFAIDFNDRAAVVQAALNSSPTLARLRSEVDAARERIGPASQLPNPMVMAGIRDKQIDLSDDEMMTMYMVGASQTIVRPSKRASRRKLAELDAQAAELQIASARAELERDVLLAWWDVATTDAQLANAAAVREMIDAIVAAARVRYEVGTSAQADVIRAQLQVSDLDQQILRLQGRRREALARLLPLLGQSPDTEVPRLHPPDDIEDIQPDASSIPPADHPAIAALEAVVAAQEESARLIRLELAPDVDIEAQYGLRRVQRDMFSVTARIELPLFRRDKTIEPRVREALAARDATKLRIDELRRSLTQALAGALAAHAIATEQIRLHQQVLVPQSRLAFDSTLAAYQTGKASFDAILTTESDFLRLHLQYQEFLARHAQAVVSYEALRKGARSASMTPAADPTPSSSKAMASASEVMP